MASNQVHQHAANLTSGAIHSQTSAIQHQTQVVKRIAYNEALEKEARQKLLNECFEQFKGMNEASLSKMTNHELAEFQAKYPDEAPQSRLALHEWNRRLVVAQLKESRFATILAVVSSLAGAALGAILTKVLGS